MGRNPKSNFRFLGGRRSSTGIWSQNCRDSYAYASQTAAAMTGVEAILISERLSQLEFLY